MTLRTVMTLVLLLLAQPQWAHTSTLPAAASAEAGAQAGAPAHMHSGDTQAPPCHGAGAAAQTTGAANPAAPATHDHADGDAHDGDAGCCDDAPCGDAGCQCACSAAPPLSSVAVHAPLTLWISGGTVAPVPAPPVARPSNPFRPPI